MNQELPSRRSQKDPVALDICDVALSGVHLIEASAGTGKTFTITSIILRLLVEEELPIHSILAVTFTNAATAELKSRVYERIVAAEDALRRHLPTEGTDAAIANDPVLARLATIPDRQKVTRLLHKAKVDADRAGIYTIHGFAARMLTDHGFASGTRDDTELVGDDRALVQDIVTDFWSAEVATLSQSVFQLLGGTGFFRSLMRVGLVAAGSEGVPLVEPLHREDLESSLHDLQKAYEEARPHFLSEGESLCSLLERTTSLNRTSYAVRAVQRDYLEYCAYFERGESSFGHPDSARFTQRKVDAAIKKNTLPLSHPLLLHLERLYDANARVKVAARELEDSLRYRLCQIVRDCVGKEHARTRTQSFDGLLKDFYSALKRSGQGAALAAEIRNSWPVALIDEFQDTDPVQYEIFRRIYVDRSETSAARALYLIGDPKQSIYAFRGADVHTYLRATADASAGIWMLDTSYRASPSLVRAQNAIFGGPRQAFCVEGIDFHPVKSRPGAGDILVDAAGGSLPGVQFVLAPSADEATVLVQIAEEVARFLLAGFQLGERPISPSDIAVLTRTNRQAQEVQAHLRELGIAAVMHGDRSVFESPEAKELWRVCQALAEPGNRSLVRTALATRLLGLTATDLASLDSDTELLEKWTTELRGWGELWRARGIAHAVEALGASTQLMSRTLGELDGERRMTNFRHLLELLHEAEVTEHLGVVGLLRYLEGVLFDSGSFAMAAEARQLRLESDAHAVTLTTAHKSKGLEYEVVFLPSLGLGDRNFGDEAFRYYDSDREESLLEMRNKDSRDKSEEIRISEARQEALRLAYVALTRAKHHVVAVVPPLKRSFSALHYLLHERNSEGPPGIESFLNRTQGGRGNTQEKDERLRRIQEQELCDLVGGSGGAISVSSVRSDKPLCQARELDRGALAPPVPLTPLPERERTSSFSGMTRGSHTALSRAAREGRDVDEVVRSIEGEADEFVAALPRGSRCLLADFPRGAQPGETLHAIFEHSPFAEGTAEQRLAVAQRELQRRGLKGVDVGVVSRSVEDVLSTPLLSSVASSPLLLGSLKAAERSAEMEFHFPIGRADHRLSAARLARALGHKDLPPGAPREAREEQGEIGCGLNQAYLQRVSELSFSSWSGFLRGFMDLVYVHEGRLYGLDYKSNYLGDTYDDYHPGALQSAMEEHHYLLQALLYAVAIHRYGQARILGYDFERHFGGMHYLFVRGMHPERPGRGVYFMRPSKDFLEGLSDVLAGPPLVLEAE